MTDHRLPDDPPLFFETHMFVCCNRRPDGHSRGSCAAKGSEALRDYMKARAKELGLKRRAGEHGRVPRPLRAGAVRGDLSRGGLVQREQPRGRGCGAGAACARRRARARADAAGQVAPSPGQVMTSGTGAAEGATIFAVASGAGRAAITVLRISGPRCARRAGRALPAPAAAARRGAANPARTATGEVLDRALVLWLPGPGSYTGEDSAELHLHGGRAVLASVTEALLEAGARPAEAGRVHPPRLPQRPARPAAGRGHRRPGGRRDRGAAAAGADADGGGAGRALPRLGGAADWPAGGAGGADRFPGRGPAARGGGRTGVAISRRCATRSPPISTIAGAASGCARGWCSPSPGRRTPASRP